jgi:hypothetical protein
MALIRCQQGHFYDPSQHNACPYCGSMPAGGMGATEAQSPASPPIGAGPSPIGATRPMRDTPPPVVGPTVPIRPGRIPLVGQKGPEEGRTVAVDMKKVGIDPVVGWLVCIKGPSRGKDYRIRSGRNGIGRSEAMDVQITGDNTVSRENHAFLVYEPRKRIFSIRPGDGRGLVYLNGDEVVQASDIKGYDVIELGETQLMFVPLCNEKFSWDQEKEEPAEK